jgi:hypothetical protein
MVRHLSTPNVISTPPNKCLELLDLHHSKGNALDACATLHALGELGDVIDGKCFETSGIHDGFGDSKLVLLRRTCNATSLEEGTHLHCHLCSHPDLMDVAAPDASEDDRPPTYVANSSPCSCEPDPAPPDDTLPAGLPLVEKVLCLQRLRHRAHSSLEPIIAEANGDLCDDVSSIFAEAARCQERGFMATPVTQGTVPLDPF